MSFPLPHLVEYSDLAVIEVADGTMASAFEQNTWAVRFSWYVGFQMFDAVRMLPANAKAFNRDELSRAVDEAAQSAWDQLQRYREKAAAQGGKSRATATSDEG